MKAYSTEQNSIRKIWPSYQYYPAAIYFRLFDREFFRRIAFKIKQEGQSGEQVKPERQNEKTAKQIPGWVNYTFQLPSPVLYLRAGVSFCSALKSNKKAVTILLLLR